MSDHIHGPGCGHPMGSWEKSSEVAASRLADAVRQNIIAAVRLQSGRITADEFDATTREVHAALQAFDAALAAPAADGLDVERLPLLNLIDQRHIQDVRFGNATGLGEDEVARKANIESDLLRRRIVAALATPEALDVEGKECPMCGGKGRIYDITESMNELMGKGAAMVLPLEPSREPGEER